MKPNASFFILIIACTFLAAGSVSAQDEIDESAGQFPRQWVNETGSITLHAPEIEAWPDFAVVDARAAIEVTLSGEDEPSIGAILFTARTETNLDLRLIALDDITLTDINFTDSMPAERQENISQFVRDTLPLAPTEIPVEVVLSYISSNTELPSIDGIRTNAPPIFYSSNPAVLLQTDGEPLFAPIEDTRLQYVINTNWDLFRYRDREWYLLHEGYWLKSDELTGPWDYDRRIPGDFEDLPADGNWTTARGAIPADRTDDDAPRVYFSDRPAELILTDGAPIRTAMGPLGLDYVSNTDSDLFIYQDEYYFLVSGRWFKAAVLRGPWTHQTTLPNVFAQIPADHPKGRVLASVPGTDEAWLAALEALIPRRAVVSRDAGATVSVTYFGEPSFEAIAGTTVSRATNSSNDVLFADGSYYLCLNAVWYVAASAEGAWEVADTIPAAVYSIPPSSPVYHVTNVQVYESDNDSVSVGFTGGYMGVYVSYGVAMWGTGWYYPHYSYYSPFYPYPYYYPYPYSYGSSAYYNPNTGMYGRIDSVYGPYGGYGRGSAYNPETGSYRRGQAVWDNNEIAGSGVAYNPRTGTGVAANRYASEYGGWGETLITQDDRWLYTNGQWTENSRRTEFETSGGAAGDFQSNRTGDLVTREGNITRGDQSLTTQSARNEQGGVIGLETGQGEQLAIGRDAANGDLYAGRDGNVYRRSDEGWQQRDGDAWQSVDIPEDRAQQIQQTRTAAQDRVSNSERIQAASQSISDRSNRSFDRSGSTNSSSNRSRDLNQSYRARTSGYNQFNRSRSGSSGFGAGRGTGGRAGGGFGGGGRSPRR